MKQQLDVRVIVAGAFPTEEVALLSVLRNGGYALHASKVHDLASFDDALRQQLNDIVIWCRDEAKLTLREAQELISQQDPDLPVIGVRNGRAGGDAADMLLLGAKDVVSLDAPGDLLTVVERELKQLGQLREHRRADDSHEQERPRSSSRIEASRDAIAFVRNGEHLHANQRYRQMFDSSYLEDFRGTRLIDLVETEDAARFRAFLESMVQGAPEATIEVRTRRPGAGVSSTRFELTRFDFEGEDVFEVKAFDSVDHDAMERRLHHLYRIDRLTGLINHQYFLGVIEDAVKAALESDKYSVLMLIEFERFRSIRHNLGITATDLVVRDLANLVRTVVSDAGCLARFGDNTFALLRGDNDIVSAEQTAKRIREAVRGHVSEAAGPSVATTCSIGITIINHSTPSIQTALHHADIACQAAIQAGGNCTRLHSAPDELEEESSGLLPAERIQTAIEGEDVTLVLEPIISLHGELAEFFGVEVNMLDETGQTLPPDVLAESALRAQLSVDLDKWKIAQVVRQLADREGPYVNAHFFVRLSDESLSDPSMIEHLRALLDEHGVDGSRLVLELSETAALNDVRAARRFIEQLAPLGCVTALSRFGTDSGSHCLLEHLDVAMLKIDAALTKDLVSSAASQQAIRTLQDNARHHHKTTIAVLTEDATALAVLWSCGVDYVQGDYVTPAPIELDEDFAGLTGTWQQRRRNRSAISH